MLQIHRRLIDSLYVEAMVLADEARAYFDNFPQDERDLLDALARVTFSCESLKVTTRLMHIIAWLLTQRAIHAGEISLTEACRANRRLGGNPPTKSTALASLPEQAVVLIEASIDLYRRVARLDTRPEETFMILSPVRSMLDRLRAGLGVF